MCSSYMKKYTKIYLALLSVSRDNPLMLKGLKSADLKIIQMYHFRLKWKRYMVCTNFWTPTFCSGTPTFSSGTPGFCRMGVLNSCFQNPSESSDHFNPFKTNGMFYKD